MIAKYSTTLVSLCLLCLFIAGCGGGNDTEGEESAIDVFNVTGNIRAAGSTILETDGSSRSNTYTYDSDGRLAVIDSTSNGSLTFTRSYSYAEDGRLLTVFDDPTAEDRQDVLREEQYDGSNVSGSFFSVFGEPVSLIRRYEYTFGEITGYQELQLEPPLENPLLTDGALIRVGSYFYSDAGFVTRLEIRSTNGEVESDRDIVYLNDTDGRRISHQVFNMNSELTSTTTWVYENAPCIGFPNGSISQWVCLQ